MYIYVLNTGFERYAIEVLLVQIHIAFQVSLQKM